MEIRVSTTSDVDQNKWRYILSSIAQAATPLQMLHSVIGEEKCLLRGNAGIPFRLWMFYLSPHSNKSFVLKSKCDEFLIMGTGDTCSEHRLCLQLP
ncbi:MAG: hypothetical protein QOD84_1024 [Acidobacteriaceae bacterium]